MRRSRSVPSACGARACSPVDLLLVCSTGQWKQVPRLAGAAARVPSASTGAQGG